jgi:chaperone modulatory protein CbpM
MEMQQFLRQSRLDTPTVNAWIKAEWLLPLSGGTASQFSDADLARARLICDLKEDFGVNNEGISIILHLLDQLHGLRCLLRDIEAMLASSRDEDGRGRGAG